MKRPSLTPRELQVLRLMAAGHTRKTAAADIGGSYHTVKDRLTDIRNKLRATTTAQAVAIAHQAGLL